jgi:hypothetical protein
MPAGGDVPGGGDTGQGRRAGGSAQRMTWVEWYEAKVGPQREVTPTDGETVKELTPIEHVRACLLMDQAKYSFDKRPTLVYFHYPHDHRVHGEATKDMCSKALDDETVARWGMLFRCVQVDMAASDVRLVQLLGAEGKPGVVVLDEQTQVVAHIPPQTNPKRLQKALKDAIQKFPEQWKSIQKEVADQTKLLADAKKAAKVDDLTGALALVNRIRVSNVRIGEAFEESLHLGVELEQKIARAEAKDGK